MTRVKRGTIANKRRKNVLSMTKGYRFGRSTKEAQAKEAIFHAGTYAFAHRRDKKGEARRVWQVRINASVRALGGTYSTFMDKMKKAGIIVDRKILSELALSRPASFKRVFDKVN
ncbi:MAG: 50S ribosomal protein L20 [Candidatus Pacebacteria bacterium]|jgi:large subunit ribosomal protein L20|nr:50S ribosomal protein L20 [Candidatus Paceibacterota bacterium]MBP9701155.1 50S ribosomal protein L20 [Candidatus Paceibacterota bacterium]